MSQVRFLDCTMWKSGAFSFLLIRDRMQILYTPCGLSENLFSKSVNKFDIQIRENNLHSEILCLLPEHLRKVFGIQRKI